MPGLQDPVTLHLLDPSREQQDRFRPLPERAIRNGRPRTVTVHAGRMSARPQSPSWPVPRRPQSAASPAGAKAATVRRRPHSAAPRRGMNPVSHAVQPDPRSGLQPGEQPGGTSAHSAAVPGFEMSGITAQDLQGAGILYTAEAPLLHGRPKAATPAAPPSPRPPRRGTRAKDEPKTCKVSDVAQSGSMRLLRGCTGLGARVLVGISCW